MASTYDGNLFSIEKMGQGDKEGTWGDTTNLNWLAIQQAIGMRVEIDVDSILPDSTTNYHNASATLTWIIPNATSPVAGNEDEKSRSSYVSVTGDGGGGKARIDFKICGNTSADEVDRLYFIKNSLTDTEEPHTILRVYNGSETGSFVEIKNGNTSLVSLSKDETTKAIDVTSVLQVGKIDFSNDSTGEIILQGSAANSLKIDQIKSDNTLLTVAKVDTTKGVTSLAVVGGSGYTNGTHPLVFTGGSPTVAASGTVVVSGGALSSPIITAQGSGYSGSVPTITFPAAGGGSGGSVTATLGEASVFDLTGSTTNITKGVIEQATIGAATPLSGAFTTLGSTGSATFGSGSTDVTLTLGSSDADTIDLNAKITGPIAFPDGGDDSAANNIGSTTSRVAAMQVQTVTVNNNGTPQVIFNSGGSTGEDSTQFGQVFATSTDRLYLEAAADYDSTGGTRLYLDESDNKIWYEADTDGSTPVGPFSLTPGYDQGLKAETLGTITKVSGTIGGARAYKSIEIECTEAVVNNEFGRQDHGGDGTAPVHVSFYMYMHGSGTDHGWAQGDRMPYYFIHADNYYGSMPAWTDDEIFMIGTQFPAHGKRKGDGTSTNKGGFDVIASKWRWVIQCWW